MNEDKEKKEKVAFHEFKKRMEGDMEDEMYKDDNVFYKFLIARDYDVDKAEYMLRQHLEWRKKYDVKNTLKYQPPEVLEKYFILTMLGHDKEGRVLKYNNFAAIDYRGIFESCKIEDWYKSLILFFEKDILELKRQSEKLGRTMDKVVYIVNMQHFSLAKATDRKVITNMISSINMYMDNYPETLHAAHVINAPIYFNIFFSMMKPFLPNTVMRKIKIYSNENGAKDLLEAIDAEVLPMFLGGKRTDPDGNPMCLTIIKNPEVVPKSYYLCENIRFANLPEVQKITVPIAEVHQIHLEVKMPGSFLEWEFKIKSGDIKFGIFYQDKTGKRNEIIPLQRLNTDQKTEMGAYKCEDTGTYIAVFDNSYSIFRSKVIYCKIKVNSQCELSSD